MLNRSLVTLFLLFLSGSMAWANPFSGSGAEAAIPAEAGLWDGVMRWIESWQVEFSKNLHEILAGLVDGQLEQYLPHALWLSFAYGILHALGPGHAKTVIASYFLSQPGSVRKVLGASLQVAAAHIVSAVAIVCLLYYGLQIGLGEFGRQSDIISRTCYALIVLLGFWLLARQIKTIRHPHAHDHAHEHGEGQACCAHHHPANGRKDKSLHILSWTAGVVPCPGPILAMLFMAAQGYLGIGIALAAVMALGMAVTIFTVALTAMGARKAMLGGASFMGGESSYRILFHALGIIGALLVILLGFALYSSVG